MEDKHILDLFAQREEMALVETAKKYGAYLLKICMNILNIRQDSEECVNDTYHTAWNNIPPQRPNKLLAYLGRIAKNLSLDRYDYLTAQKRNTHFDTTLSELEGVLSDRSDVFDRISEQELSASISRFLRTTGEKGRNMFIRRYWYHDSISDIAKQFGATENNVKVTLSRVRSKLKTHLEGEGYLV